MIAASRIDYIFTSKNTALILKTITTTVKNDWYGKRLTDHRAVILTSVINVPVRGPGYWKLDISMLNDTKWH